MTRLGLCGWTINAAGYFATFDTLEVQQTFYEPPSRLTMDRWREQAPAGFVFTIKAWQLITHRSTSSTYKRLKSEVNRDEVGAFQVNATTMHGWKVTRDCARLLRAKAILFQCPASFRATEENIANMRRFFAEIDRLDGVDYLWEPRGPWPDDVIADVCAELGLEHVVDPLVRDVVTPGLVYWRLHGVKNHYHSYTDDELRALAARVQADRETYVMFNNVPRVGDAKRFRTFLPGRASASPS
ncbi:MAG TPA: DUF72 domain-containing protein [Thermoanaerobaculia bacterium]|nr:DUF72 domain-containing protein [Thermoanaerobaculia bacterium]